MKIEGVELVLLDIEGTILPIDFVKNELYPYALRALPQLLADHFATPNPDLAPAMALFPPEARQNATTLLAHLEDLTRRDVKDPGLKQLQGHVWRQGYLDGALKARLFPDVTPAFDRWLSAGVQLAIYSSGSVQAQRLLFQHVEAEGGAVTDCEGYFGGRYFDTLNAGGKTEQGSYGRIAEAVGRTPAAVLFLSDNEKEVLAAIAAGMKSVLVKRPGNPAQEKEASLDVVETFEDLELA